MSAEIGCYWSHALCEDAGSSRKAEGKGLEFVDSILERETEKLSVILVYINVKIGIGWVNDSEPNVALKR